MIRLEAYGDTEAMTAVARLLDDIDDVSRVRLTDATRAGRAVVVATVQPKAVDELLRDLRRLGVPENDVTLTREEVLGRSSGSGAEAGLVWEDVLGMATRNSRPIARYLAFMVAAGVVACYGVTNFNGILIVGAMAMSPDLLPISAISVGLIDRRPRLAWRAFVTLAIGMAAVSAAAAVVAAVLNLFDSIPASFDINSTVLGGLTDVNSETVVVALAAGVAGMLALETRASFGVGVAVSVTTIPAAAYLGVALALGEGGNVKGALAVLGVNVGVLVVAASSTLLSQRAVTQRVAAKRQLEHP